MYAQLNHSLNTNYSLYWIKAEYGKTKYCTVTQVIASLPPSNQHGKQ